MQGTRSGDLVGLGTVATTPADGWQINPPVGPFTGSKAPHDALLLLFEADASGDTIVIQAGANPPSKQAGKGSLDVVLAASDVRLIQVDPARHVKADGTIVAVCTDAGTRCYAFTLPRQVGRGG